MISIHASSVSASRTEIGKAVKVGRGPATVMGKSLRGTPLEAGPGKARSGARPLSQETCRVNRDESPALRGGSRRWNHSAFVVGAARDTRVLARVTIWCSAGELGGVRRRSVGVLDGDRRAQYDDRFATVEELLDQVPGVRVRRFGGLGAYSTASIRGVEVGAGAGAARRRAHEQRVARRGGPFDLARAPDRAHRGAARRGRAALRQRRRRRRACSITTRRPEEAASPRPTRRSRRAATTRCGGDVALSGASERGERARELLAPAQRQRLRVRRRCRRAAVGRRRPGARHATSRLTRKRLNADFVEDSGLLRGGLALGAERAPRRTRRSVPQGRRRAGQHSGQALAGATDEELSCTEADADAAARRRAAGVGRRRARPRGPLRRRSSSRRACACRTASCAIPGSACGSCQPIVTGRRRVDVAGAQLRARRRAGAWPSSRGSTAALRHRAAAAPRGLRYDTVEPVRRRHAAAHDGVALAAARARALRRHPAPVPRARRGSTRPRARDSTRIAAFQPLVAVRAARRDRLAARRSARSSQVAPGLRLKANWKRVVAAPARSRSCSTPTGASSAATRRSAPRRAGTPTWASSSRSPGAGFVRDVHARGGRLFQRELEQGIEWLLSTARAFMPLNTDRRACSAPRSSLGRDLLRDARRSTRATRTPTRASWAAIRGRRRSRTASDLCFPHVPENAVTGWAPRSQLGTGRAVERAALRERDRATRSAASTLAPATTQVDAGHQLPPAPDHELELLPRGALALGRGSEPDRRAALRLARPAAAQGAALAGAPARSHAMNLAGALLAVTLTVGVAGDRHARLLTHVPARARGASDESRPRLRRRSRRTAPGSSSCASRPAQSLAYAGAARIVPGRLQLQQSAPFTTPNVGGFSLERGSGVTRGWLTTSSCELAVPFDYATGARSQRATTRDSNRSAVPTR